MGGSKGGGQTIGYRYYMSLLMGISRGPVDEIVQMDAGNIRAWPVPDGDSETVKGLMVIAEGPNGTGVAQYEDGTYETVAGSQINTIRGTGDYSINAPELFGGDKKEGGVSGFLRVMMGSVTQVVPSYIKTLMGGRVPDFRGVATVYFDGLLTSMNPYPKKWEWRVRRTQSGWDGDVWQPSLVTIWLRGGTIKAMNPAHILYEAFTNRDWGRGLSRDWIDEREWLKAAEALYNESFGLCLRYSRQSELSDFIQDVVDHIGGSIYPDRSTGRLALSLLRDDYELDDLPLFTYDTGLISLGDVETAGQDDLVNEVVVKWVDPITKTERSARVQNIALHQSMGASSSTTATYAGIADVDLALRLCQRDLKANSNALKRFTVVLDRRAWRITPGKAFRISVPERGIFNAVLRAGKVSQEGGGDGRITVTAVLDVFGLPSASFITAQESEWEPPNRDVLIADRLVVREATYAELARVLDAANLALVDTASSTVATIVGKPSSMSQGYEVSVLATGATTPVVGRGVFSPFVISTNLIPATPGATVVSYDEGSDIGLIEVGMGVQLDGEICRLDDIDPTLGTVTIARGCFDTIPREHPIGSTLFFVKDEVGGDGKEYASGDSVEVKVLPFTSTNKLAESLAPVTELTLVGRQGRPYPPANLRVNGEPFAVASTIMSDIILTWVHRNRLVQQDQFVDQTEASIGPEAGTTYTVRVYDGDTLSPVRTVTGLSGTGWTYTLTMAAEDSMGGEVWFEVESVRSALVSFYRYRFGVTFLPEGYGLTGYGDAYGE